MKLKHHAAILATVSLFALAGPAFAQDAQPQPAMEEQPGATTSNTTAAEADTSTPAADELMGGDIVVTATRRAERLQDVPLAVSALTGDQLQESGFQSLQDI